MIKFGLHKFAENETEFTDSLFHDDGTCYGFAKRNKRSIKLYDQQHNIFGVINQERVLGSARRLDNGKVWYSYGTPKIFESMNHCDVHNSIEMLAIGHDHIGLIFK